MPCVCAWTFAAMPTVRGVPNKRPAFEGEGWKAAATDAKQMRGKVVFSPTRRGYIIEKLFLIIETPRYPDLTVPYN